MTSKVPQLFLENQLCFPLYATSRMMTKLYAPYLKALDITYPQYLLFLTLWQHGAQPVKTIGERLFLESNTLTPLLKRLEQKELIRRTRSQEDERTVMISLTQSGVDLQVKAKTIPDQILASFQNSVLEEKELEQFRSMLFRLLGTLHTSGEGGTTCD